VRRLFVLIALVAVVAVACGGGGAGEASIKTIKAAADNTQAAGSEQFTIHMSLDAAGRHVEMNGSGVATTDGPRARVELDVGGVATIEEIVVDRVIYLSLDGLPGAGALPDGKKWFSIDLDALAGQFGANLDDLFGQTRNSTPTQALEYLRALSGDVQTIGDDTVAGEHAVHYRAAIDYSKVVDELPDLPASVQEKLAALGTLPVDVWIDDHDRVVKMRYTVDAASLGTGVQGTAEITMEITAFDVPVDVQPPPPDEVVSVSDVLAGRDTVSA
jgi:hypothetical protein